MYRVAFSTNDSAERQQLSTALQRCTLADARIVAAFADTTTVEVYLDMTDAAIPREIAGQLAQRLGFAEYTVTRVDALATAQVGSDGTIHRGHLRPATITQVRVQPDDRTLSVQARHRPSETVETIDVQETGDSVTIAVSVAAFDDDLSRQYVSLAVAFSWIETVLADPVGDRRVIRHDPANGFLRTRPRDDGEPIVAIPDWMRREVAIEPESAPTSVHELSPEQVLARLELVVERTRTCAGRAAPATGRAPAATLTASQ